MRTFFTILILLLANGPVLSQTSFYFDGKEIKPGTKAHFEILVNDKNDSTYLPITIFNGAKDGPVLGITAGVHGYEYPPIMAAQKLIKSITPEDLTGSVIIVQIANLESFKGRSPYVNPLDNKNLNRRFPGKTDGSVTEQLANYITGQVISKSDYFLDMHSGDAPEDLMPYSAYYYNSEMTKASSKGLEMAKSLDFDHIVVFQTDGKDYMRKDKPSLYCSAEAFKRDIPSIDIECGRLGVADPLLIQKIETGVLGLMQHLEMLKSNKPDLQSKKHIIINQRFYVSAQTSGIFYPSKESGEYVSKGMIIGKVTNYFGKDVETIYANEDGVLLMILGTPPVNKGETIAVIGKVN